jgi:tetratricopeptide (TPR) repeat protein
MDGLLSRIMRMDDPVAKARRLASLARIFAQNGNYEDATTMAKHLKSALAECPPNFDLRNLYDDGTTGLELIKWLRAIADACYAKKDFKLAAYFYTKAQTSLGASSTFTHRRLSMKLADAYLQDNRIRDAEVMFKRAAGAPPTSELNPDLFVIDKNDMFCEDRAIWMSKVGDIDAAMAKYPQAAIAYFGAAQEWAKEPTLAYSGQSFFRLAQCYEKLGKWKDAELALRDSIKQLSSSPNAAGKANLPAVWKELADVLQQQNKVWDSLQASKEAHSLAKELAK